MPPAEAAPRVEGPVLPWPGSKWRIAEWIVGHFVAHECYVEPYLGSGGVFFLKPPSPVEIINDLDGSVYNLFWVLRERPAELAARLELTPWSREEFREAARFPDEGDEVERARRLLVYRCQGISRRRHEPSGTSGWRTRASVGQDPVTLWRKMPERVMAAAERLMEAQIECRPALQVIQRFADREALLYLDPPYHPDAREVRHYAHEMGDADHRDLLEALELHPGPVLLSGYATPLYDYRLRHWRRLERPARAQNNAARTEVLWLSPVAVSRLERARRGLFEGVSW